MNARERIEESDGYRQAAAQLQSLREHVDAMRADWDWLDGLREEKRVYAQNVDDAAGTDDEYAMRADFTEWVFEHGAELAELEDKVNGYESEDDARQRIEEHPLCVDVRSDWTAAGAELEPAEFRILLCTGGPAVQIVGDLNEHAEPHSARIQFQDWFTPWRDYPTSEEEDAALLEYARVFYFGE